MRREMCRLLSPRNDVENQEVEFQNVYKTTDNVHIPIGPFFKPTTLYPGGIRSHDS
jgi:hypothetical protein